MGLKHNHFRCLSDALGMNEIDDDDDNESEFSSMGSVMSLNELCRSTGTLSYRSSGIRRNRWISR